MRAENPKVLIVDDDGTAREIIRSAVEEAGGVGICSPDGQHALTTLEVNEDIALIITDMVMPGMDGRELIEAVAQIRDLQEFPILIMSAVVGVRDISDLLKLGARAFLQKPLKISELQEYVNRYLFHSYTRPT